MRKTLHLLIYIISFVLFLGITSEKARASHAMGIDIEYSCLNPNNGTYRVTVWFYRDCSGISEPSSLQLRSFTPSGCFNTVNNPITTTLPKQACPPNTIVDSCTGASYTPSPCEASGLCPTFLPQSSCNSSAPNALPGVERFRYENTVTLPSGPGGRCSDWINAVAISARNPNTNLVNSGTMYAFCEINDQAIANSNVCNSGPVFSNPAVPYICDQIPYTYSHGAIDPDGDSLRYMFVQPLNNWLTTIAHSFPFTLPQPMSTTPAGPMVFDSLSGQMSFTPNGVQQPVVTIRVEQYDPVTGQYLGATMRDMQYVVLANSLCNTSPPQIPDSPSLVFGGQRLPGKRIQVCPGTQVVLGFTVIDPAGNNLTITSDIQGPNNPLPGASFAQIGNGCNDTATGQLIWTPQPQDSGTNRFTITARSDGCPVIGLSSQSFTIVVIPDVNLTPDTAVYCGTPVQLEATGGSVFSWSPVAGLSDTTIQNPTAAPSVNTTYIYDSDCGADSSYIIVNPPFTVDAGPPDSICMNGLTQLQGFTDSLYAPYTYQWQPSAGLTFPTSSNPNDTVLQPFASPTQSTRYFLYATGNNGCERVDSVDITVTGIAPLIVASADQDTVCPGDPVNFDIISNPRSCGLNTIPCGGVPVTGDVGTSNNVQGGSPTQYPTVYGNWVNSQRVQILYRGPEITAAMGSGGTIEEIAFEIGQFYSAGVLNNFTIKMGCTQINTLTNWQAGLSTVFTPKNVTPANGWNTHVLDNPYDWDGSSNLIVEICYEANNSGNFNNKMRFTNPGYDCLLYNFGSQSQCQVSNLSNPASRERPNTRFQFCVTDLNTLNIQWTPATGPNAPNPNNVVQPTATPQSTTAYIANADDGGCVGQSAVTVFVTAPSVDARPDTFVCSSAPVTIEAVMSQPGSYTYNWTASPADPSLAGQTTSRNPTVTPTQPTVYTVTVSGGPCTVTDTVFVNVGGSLPINMIPTNISCGGANDGMIIATPQGGNAPFTYTWSPNVSTNDTAQNLAPGTYSVTVVDAGLCQGADTVTITQPAPLVGNWTKTDVACNGDSTGSATFTVNGGTPTYSYSWNPNVSSAAIANNLPSGTFRVTVLDNNNCSIDDSIIITEPPALTLSLTPTNSSANGANDGSITSSVGGGNAACAGGYTYAWTGPAGPYPTTPNLSNLGPGWYTLTVTDCNGCTITDSAFVYEPPPIFVTPTIVDNPCFGDSVGSISVTVAGGDPPYTYQWNTNPADTTPAISNLPAGNYTLSVTDSNGIMVINTFPVAQPSQVTMSFNVTNVSCFGFSDGAITASPAGGTPPYSYAWSNGGNSASITALPIGTYVLTVTDSNNCIGIDSAVVTEPDSLDLTVSNVQDISCFGADDGSADAATTGGTPPYTYAWSNSLSGTTAGTVTDLRPGAQTVMVTDDNGCNKMDSLSVTEPNDIVLQISGTDASCDLSNDGSAYVVATGGTGAYTYNWNPNVGNTDSVVNLAGLTTYSVTVTDQNGCTENTNIYVDTVYRLSAFATADSANCFNEPSGSATITATNGTGPYSYSWSSGSLSQTATNLVAATYTATVTDNLGCRATASATVLQPSQIITITDTERPNCVGESTGKAWVSASGGTPGYTYSWSTLPVQQTDTAFGLSRGNYNVTVTDANGCTVANSANVLDPLSLRFTGITRSEISCASDEDGEVTVFVTGGTGQLTALWSNGNNGFTNSNLGPGTYSVTISDEKGCEIDTAITFNAPPRLVFGATFPIDASCYGLEDGEIWVQGAQGTRDPAFGYEYSIDGVTWITTEGDPANDVTGRFRELAAGTYTVYVRDANGCTIDTTITVGQPDEIFVYIEPGDTNIALGDQIPLNVRIAPYDNSVVNSYFWTPSNGLSCMDCQNPVASPYVTTTYTVTVDYLNDCIGTQEIEILVGPGTPIFVPNMFTPNGDGLNDYLMVYGRDIARAHMRIFDRWGEMVFETYSQHNGWDGTYKGEMMRPGVYVYQLEVEYLNGEEAFFNGSVTLVR